MHKNLGDHRAAIQRYDAALRLDPRMRAAHFNKARSLQSLSDGLAAYTNASARDSDLRAALSHFMASVDD